MMSWNIRFRYYQRVCKECAAGLWRAGSKWHYLQLSLWLFIPKCLSSAADLRGYTTLASRQLHSKTHQRIHLSTKITWQNEGLLQLFNSLSHHGITHRTDQKSQPKKTQHEMALNATPLHFVSAFICRNRADKNEEKRHKNRGWIWFPQAEKTRYEWY